VVEPHEHVARRAAYRVAHDNDTVTDINGIQNRCKHANVVGFRPESITRQQLCAPQNPAERHMVTVDDRRETVSLIGSDKVEAKVQRSTAKMTARSEACSE